MLTTVCQVLVGGANITITTFRVLYFGRNLYNEFGIEG